MILRWMLTMYLSYLSHVTDNNCHDDSIDRDRFTEDDAERRHLESAVYMFEIFISVHCCVIAKTHKH